MIPADDISPEVKNFDPYIATLCEKNAGKEIPCLNIPALLKSSVNFEIFCRDWYKVKSENGTVDVNKDDQKEIEKMNYRVFQQFISSSFSTNYAALENFE